MKVLVTGSSGFIGRHLVETLLQAGHDAWGTDVAPPPERQRQRFIRCDLLDQERMQDVVGTVSPAAVVHLAARTDLNGVDADAYAVNTLGTRHLLEAMAKTKSVKRCVFTSTQLVHPPGHAPDNDEEHCPTTQYGASKAAMERLIRHLRGGVPTWCIVRPTTVWGPGVQEHYVRFFRMVQRSRYFHVGRRPLWKSYSYVGNIAHQYRKLLEAPAGAVHERVFYLADYQPLSLQDWADGLQRALGARRIPTCPVTAARLAANVGDVLRWLGWRRCPFHSFRLNNILTEYVYDLAATRKVCGELPYTQEEGIEETVRWIRSL